MYQSKKKEASTRVVGRKPFLTRKLIITCALAVTAVAIILGFLFLQRFATIPHRLDVLSETVKNQGIRLDQQRINITSLSHQVKIAEEKLIANEVVIEQNHKYMLQLKENLTLKMLNFGKSEEVTNGSFKVELEVKKHLADIDQAIKNLQEAKKHWSDQSLQIKQEVKKHLADQSLQNKQEMEKHLADQSLRNKQEMEKHSADIHRAIDNFQSTGNSVLKHCHSSTESCEMGSRGDAPYWRACRTAFLSIDEPGFISFIQGCSISARNESYSEVLTAFEKDGKIRCDCDVTFPGGDSPKQREVDKTPATCTLTIMRCPT